MKYNVTRTVFTVETYKRKKKKSRKKVLKQMYKSGSPSSKSTMQLTNKFRIGYYARKREGKQDSFFRTKLQVILENAYMHPHSNLFCKSAVL